MKFSILVYLGEADIRDSADPVRGPAQIAAVTAYARALAEAGIHAGGAGLRPPATATTLRLRDGKHLVQDGPFAVTKEQLGGFFVIDVPDLDTALEWAARSPSASHAGAEVRPLIPRVG